MGEKINLLAQVTKSDEEVLAGLGEFDEKHDSVDNLIGYRQHFVSRRPVSSIGTYADCNGVAVIDSRKPGLCGITHYDLSHEKPEKYLDCVMKVFKMRRWRAKPVSVIVAGDDEHFSMIEDFMKKMGIPVVGSHRDGWKQGKYSYQLPYRVGQKNMIVYPQTNEVLVYSHLSGLYRLDTEALKRLDLY